ncbi:MAG: RNA-binding protein [Alcanivorax sp.]|nr:RNA-binding protein [Alcanivorax sp.]
MSDAVRIDKWLWAARFFKTRSLAQQAVEGGKVQIEGQRAKPSKLVKTGFTVEIRIGQDVRVVLVTGVAEKRGNATAAALLYQETDASIAAREAAAAKRSAQVAPDHRPSKKERRDLQRFRDRQ